MDGNGILPPDATTLGGVTSREDDGTNVVRVAFGVRRARRARPMRPDHWATLVLPLQVAGGGFPPMPPSAA